MLLVKKWELPLLLWMLETRLLMSNVALSGVCVHAMDFSWKAAGLEMLAATAAARNWMCFSGVICG